MPPLYVILFFFNVIFVPFPFVSGTASSFDLAFIPYYSGKPGALLRDFIYFKKLCFIMDSLS